MHEVDAIAAFLLGQNAAVLIGVSQGNAMWMTICSLFYGLPLLRRTLIGVQCNTGWNWHVHRTFCMAFHTSIAFSGMPWLTQNLSRAAYTLQSPRCAAQKDIARLNTCRISRADIGMSQQAPKKVTKCCVASWISSDSMSSKTCSPR